MAALEALALYVLVPIGVAAVAILLLRAAAEETLRALPTGAIPDRGRARLPVAFALAAAPIPLGLALWILADPVAQDTDAGTLMGAADASRMLVWASTAFAFGAAGFGASVVLCVRSRTAGFLASDFGRILPMAVIPFTGVIFALVLNFLLVGYLLDFVPGHAIPASATAASVDAVIGAFQAYTVATLAFPTATLASNRVRDMSSRGLMRAMLLLEMGELPVLVGLVLGFLAISGLSAPSP